MRGKRKKGKGKGEEEYRESGDWGGSDRLGGQGQGLDEKIGEVNQMY